MSFEKTILDRIAAARRGLKVQIECAAPPGEDETDAWAVLDVEGALVIEWFDTEEEAAAYAEEHGYEVIP